ncbi:hypothetical protein PMAA_015390 [Talaromyces marneffei ATCC 18224]|uniref:Uncharacterized protein n=1 Tax=Talaromyces marneffei (strain ATCC 18224 / CBS 334.59 / QM 7333) TaxID=441960 RepID=B6Q6T3_TALMQ|nr:hypothetical protein PMAA_015390 [Talaromyces marneffei ATCC 18224]
MTNSNPFQNAYFEQVVDFPIVICRECSLLVPRSHPSIPVGLLYCNPDSVVYGNSARRPHAVRRPAPKTNHPPKVIGWMTTSLTPNWIPNPMWNLNPRPIKPQSPSYLIRKAIELADPDEEAESTSSMLDEDWDSTYSRSPSPITRKKGCLQWVTQMMD